MFRLLERHQTLIVIFVALALPVLVYRANSREAANTRFVDRVILAATAPIQRGMTWAVGEVSDAWYHYVDVVNARREVGELRKRLYAAERRKDELEAMAIENQHLRVMLEIKTKNPEVTLVEASVIAAGTSPLSRTIEIDKGAVDRVARGMVVIAEGGLVGLVMRAGWTTSEVMLVADEKLLLSAQVVRSRARGRLKGAGLGPGYGLELTEVNRADDVKVGDRVATSGLGGVFPKGLPIGEIKEVRTPTGAAHRIADIEPSVDFARLEHVLVLVSAPKDEPLVTPEPLRPAALRARDGDGGVDAERAGADDGGLELAQDGAVSGDGGRAVDGGRRGDAGPGRGDGGPPRTDGGLVRGDAGAPVGDGGRPARARLDDAGASSGDAGTTAREVPARPSAAETGAEPKDAGP